MPNGVHNILSGCTTIFPYECHSHFYLVSFSHADSPMTGVRAFRRISGLPAAQPGDGHPIPENAAHAAPPTRFFPPRRPADTSLPPTPIRRHADTPIRLSPPTPIRRTRRPADTSLPPRRYAPTPTRRYVSPHASIVQEPASSLLQNHSLLPESAPRHLLRSSRSKRCGHSLADRL